MHLVPTPEEIEDLTNFLEIVHQEPRKVIITPQVYGEHLAVLFRVIEGAKKVVCEAAMETGEWKHFGRLALYLEALKL